MKSPKRTVTVTRRTLATRIASLSAAQQCKILHIIRQHKVPYSRNQNGFFFDADDLSTGCLKQIHDFVNYSLSNQENLDAYDRQLQLCKQTRVPLTDNMCEIQGKSRTRVSQAFDEAALLCGDARDQLAVPSVVQYLYNRTLPRSDGSSGTATGTTKPASTTVKFMNYKKRFSKPPRNKAYDPDDTSCLANVSTDEEIDRPP
jgi:hypothetical protein